MTPEQNRTVREIALENPATVRVFEAFGIDYCCGGKRPLAEACERAGVPVAEVVHQLREASSVPGEDRDRSRDAFTELIDHIVSRHHSYVREEGPRLEALLDKVVSRHGDDHPELITIRGLFTAMHQELVTHMFKEEHILFPFLKQMDAAARAGSPLPPACFDSVGTPISRMLADHDDAGELLSRMRGLSSGFQAPAGACPSYRGLYHGLQEFERDLHFHVHLENNILFPRALEMERELREEAGCARR